MRLSSGVVVFFSFEAVVLVLSDGVDELLFKDMKRKVSMFVLHFSGIRYRTSNFFCVK